MIETFTVEILPIRFEKTTCKSWIDRNVLRKCNDMNLYVALYVCIDI